MGPLIIFPTPFLCVIFLDNFTNSVHTRYKKGLILIVIIAIYKCVCLETAANAASKKKAKTIINKKEKVLESLYLLI